MDDTKLDKKEIQTVLRQILGGFASTNTNLKELFNALSDGISVGILVTCIENNTQDVATISVFNKCLPHILELTKIITTEMNTIIRDDNLDQVTILASRVLKALIQSQQTMPN